MRNSYRLGFTTFTVESARVMEPHPDSVVIGGRKAPSGNATCREVRQGVASWSPQKEEILATQTPRRGSPAVSAADLEVPQPPQPLVLRPRLFAVLDEGTEKPLTLVSAPAGAGKTSLLSSWL